MVGVPKSTGCAICRKRKIKCDETWPICIHCQKNGKRCPGPPSRHTFKDFGPSPILNEKNSQYKTWNDAARRKCKTNQHKPSPASRNPRLLNFSNSPKPSLLSLSFVTAFPSPQHRLARTLIETLHSNSVGLPLFNLIQNRIPPRIGHSAALDAAVDCLVHVHLSSVQQNTSRDIIDPKSYIRAVQMLQVSLKDPQEVYSPNTLCAAVLLGAIEAMAGPRAGTRYMSHIRGVGQLVELQGPVKYLKDEFLLDILQFSKGGIIMSCIYDTKRCFLAAPEWQEAAFDRAESFPCEVAQEELMRLSAILPEFLCDMEELNAQGIGQNFVDGARRTKKLRTALLDKIHHFKKVLEDISASTDSRTSDGSYTFKTSAFTDSNGASDVLDMPDNHAFATFSLAGALLLASNKMLMELLPPSEPLYYAFEAESQIKAYEICNTLRAARSSNTIESFSISFGLIMAYEHCTPTAHEWILEKMNASLVTTVWSDELMRRMTEKFYWRANNS